MNKISSAVIGCGRMGAFTSENVKKYSPSCWFPLSHIEALQVSEKVIIKGVCDISENLLAKVQSRYGIKNIYKDYRQLLSEINPDILCVATRTREREDVLTTAIEMGVKAIHLEKPICNSLKQLENLEKLVIERNTLLTYGTVRRYFSIYHQAKEIIDTGQFGCLQQIQVNFGANHLFWTHPHSVDLILFFAGNRKLISTQAKLSNVVLGDKPLLIESDPIIESSTMYFDDGVTGVIGKATGMDVILSCESGIVTVESDGRRIVCRSSSDEDPYFKYPGQVIELENSGAEGTYSAISKLIQHLGDERFQTALMSEHIFTGQRTLFSFVQSHLNKNSITPIDSLDSEICVLGKVNEFFA